MKWYLKALQNYTNFEGRARRKEYWYFTLFQMIIIIILAIIAALLEDASGDSIFTTVIMVYFVATILPSIAVGVRRMHDVDRSGWYILIPYYRLYLCCIDGTKGPNLCGADPKQDHIQPED